jgi:hypothetical protein
MNKIWMALALLFKAVKDGDTTKYLAFAFHVWSTELVRVETINAHFTIFERDNRRSIPQFIILVILKFNKCFSLLIMHDQDIF